MARDFAILQKEIEDAVAKLKAVKDDPFRRRELVRNLRRLLDEAERGGDLGKKRQAS
jgi:hypothetical protein